MESSSINNRQREKEKDEDDRNQQEEWRKKAWEFLSKVREISPLIQCITNLVSMDIVVNTLLAAGAGPVPGRDSDFTPQIHALCLNMGTLFSSSLSAIKSAASVAGIHGKPWVLDPVAACSSSFRLRACLDLVELKPTVIRGNGSEIIALSRASARTGSTKGVDSVNESTEAMEAAKCLARASKAIVAVSGAVDIITDGHRLIFANNGVTMMQKITATGCSVTALTAAFIAVDPAHAFEATLSALSVFGIAGELGMETANGPASLRVSLIDSLYGLDQVTLHRRVRISRLI